MKWRCRAGLCILHGIELIEKAYESICYLLWATNISLLDMVTNSTSAEMTQPTKDAVIDLMHRLPPLGVPRHARKHDYATPEKKLQVYHLIILLYGTLLMVRWFKV